MTTHRLIIKHLYNAQAHCSACSWFLAFTGHWTAALIENEYREHLAQIGTP